MRLIGRRSKERLILAGTFFLSIIAIIPLLSILATVFINGVSAINLEFLTSLPAPFGESGGGIGNAILGTLIINSMACLFGIPLGIFTGMYLSEYGQKSRLGTAVRLVVESLSGVPSIIFGIFAFTLIVTTVRHYTAIAAAIALGLMMIPLVAKATEISMKVVSNDIREAAIALGIPKWIRTTQIVFSIAKSGVLTGCLLAFARISGETAPLLFTSLFSFFWPSQVDQPMASLQVLIYNYSLSGFQDWVLKAWGASLLLVLIVVAINVSVKFIAKPKFKGSA